MSTIETDLLSRVTVLVPIKDNPRRTLHFLEHSMKPSIRYLIADGSLRDENQKIFMEAVLPNCEYIRFSPDLTLDNYLSKMAQAVSLIHTDFVMQMDAGDFLLPEGVRSQVAQLSLSLNASCVCGDTYFTREVGKYTTPLRLASSISHIEGLSTGNALLGIKDRYTHNWYSLFRKDVLLDTWRIAVRNGIQHPFLEYLPFLVALSRGTVLRAEHPAIVRVAHGPSAWTEQPADMNSNDKSVQNDLRGFAMLMYQELDVDPDQVVDAFSSNAELVTRQALRSAGIRRLSGLLLRFGLPRVAARYLSLNAVSHVAGYWVSPRGEGMQIGKLGFTFDGIRLRNRSKVLRNVDRLQ